MGVCRLFISTVDISLTRAVMSSALIFSKCHLIASAALLQTNLISGEKGTVHPTFTAFSLFFFFNCCILLRFFYFPCCSVEFRTVLLWIQKEQKCLTNFDLACHFWQRMAFGYPSALYFPSYTVYTKRLQYYEHCLQLCTTNVLRAVASFDNTAE